MAYADKITTMRRMALLNGNNIVWEGVNIEGICVLKKDSIWGQERQEIMSIKESQIKKFCECNDDEYPLKLVYQDKKTDKHWEARTSKITK